MKNRHKTTINIKKKQNGKLGKTMIYKCAKS